MSQMIAFTDNYADRSTREGYQFEFFCRRCGNGYSSSFVKSITGFGGRLLRMGGDLIGGEVGQTAREVGWDAEWMRDGVRGPARDKALAKAGAEVQPHFRQCHRCGQWVCDKICWNPEAGLCVTCAPKMDQEVAGLQAAAQVQQVREKIQQQDWTKGVSYTDATVGMCPSCNAESGGGKFCQNCGQPLAAAPWPKRFCTSCGAQLGTTNFCGQCGSPADAPFPA